MAKIKCDNVRFYAEHWNSSDLWQCSTRVHIAIPFLRRGILQGLLFVVLTQ